MALEVELATRAGASLGRVRDPTGVAVGRGLRVPRTAELTLPPVSAHRTTVRGGPAILAKVYDVGPGTRTLKHIGPLTSYERVDDDVSLGSTDAAWYLDRRNLTIDNLPQNPYERGLLMKWAVMVAQAQPIVDGSWVAGLLADELKYLYLDAFLVVHEHTAPYLDTGVRPRTIASTPTIRLTSQKWQKISTLFSQCATGLDGPDWAIYPSEPTADAYGVRIGHLDVAPVIGTTKPNVLFQYGHGKNNVSSWREILDVAGMANMIGIQSPVGDFFLGNNPPMQAYGALHDVFPTDIDQGILINQLTFDHLTVRDDPRSIITFDVIVDPDPQDLNLTDRRVPRAGVDYDFGDVITFAAMEQVPTYAADGAQTGTTPGYAIAPTLMRVYHVREADDDSGQRTVTLTVTPT